MSILITGGSGFIGSHLVEALCRLEPNHTIVNLDAGTYASRPPIYAKRPENLIEEPIDLRDELAVYKCIQKHKPSTVFHLAAESHVCRSIAGPRDFMHTNIIGTFNLLEALRGDPVRMVYVSTDEVFGQSRNLEIFTEDSPLLPRNPYSASKASADLIVRSYNQTYGMDTVTVRMANNYGPNQHEEKLIPATIRRLLRGDPARLYGSGNNSREWLYVKDAVEGILLSAYKGLAGEVYCLTSEVEYPNHEIISMVADTIMDIRGETMEYGLIHTDDRPTDDIAYRMSGKKARAHLGFCKFTGFKHGLKETVKWYIDQWGIG